MNFEEIKLQVEFYQKRGLKLFTTSSFQTHSLVLLHMLSHIDKQIPVYFINTGFHFEETLSFKKEITQLFDLDVRELSSATPKNAQRDAGGNFLFNTDADYCCHLNKIQPLQAILPQYDVWINGIRADQSDVRKKFKTEEAAAFDTLRFHPMLNWNMKMIYAYLKEHNIPHHPLDLLGYQSIGCEPCTSKCESKTDARQGRWAGLTKTECGLHTKLVAGI